MDYVILKHFDQVYDYVRQVSALADQNKDAFGFLPASAYEQMAAKGQLWVALNSANELKGYLLFGGTMPTLKIFQVYACKTVKGYGVGKKLIDALKNHARNSGYHTISARVAEDLPANIFWEKMEFSVYRQVKGGETKKRIINIRGYSLEDNDLFGCLAKEVGGITPSRPVLDRPFYALDLNLLLDITKARPGYKKIIKIIQVGFQGGFSICITPEFRRELEGQAKNFDNDPVLRLAEAFPELRSDAGVSGVTESLRRIVFPHRDLNRKASRNDESDLMHLAYCIASGVRGFVTREKALLRACNKIKRKYGVSIISPDELIFDDGDMLDISKPLNTDFLFNSTSSTPEIRRFLEDFSIPNIISEKLFSASPVQEDRVIYEAKLNDNVFGVYFFQKPTKAMGIAVACLYVDESNPKATAAIDHFLETALRYKSGYTYRLDLYAGKGQDLTEDTLRKKGFFKLGDHFVKIICNLFLDNKNWSSFSSDVDSLCKFSIPDKLPSKKELTHTGVSFSDSEGASKVFSWFEFETIISPRFILNSDRNCIIVPIRENYANGLLGNLKNQLSLLSAHDKVLLLEKAYFRTKSKASLFKKGGIVAFYVSGGKSIQEIIGFARITYSEVINIDEATVKLDRQGVLSHDELVSISDKLGKIHVFTFDNFLEFDYRISFKRAKRLHLISNANLVSPEEIGSDKLKILIEEAFDE